MSTEGQKVNLLDDADETNSVFYLFGLDGTKNVPLLFSDELLKKQLGGFTDVQSLRLTNATADATLIASSYEIVQDDDYKSFIVTANGVVITIAQLTSDCQFTVMNNEGVTSEITTSSETYELGDGAIAVITFINGVLKISL